jgi:hypothetical protein
MSDERDIALLADALRKKLTQGVEQGRGFECAHCRLPKPASDAYAVAVYIPKEPILTEAGEKLRLVGYIVCKPCGKKSKIDKSFAERVEQNLITAGVFLDPTYKPPEDTLG